MGVYAANPVGWVPRIGAGGFEVCPDGPIHIVPVVAGFGTSLALARRENDAAHN